MHRRILNAQTGQEVDHANHNGLDNCRENIRLCTKNQNQWNQNKHQRRTSSRFKGVSWKGRNKKWCAQVQFNGKNIHLGLFTDDESAARVYDEAAKRLFGEFAKLNF